MNPKPSSLLFSQQAKAPAAVTVLIPLYNNAIFVREALDSLLQQTFQDLSLVVVDDGSEDLSRETAWEWLGQHAEKFREVFMVAHHDNHGAGAARNTGFQHVRSPFVFLLDADNLLFPRCIGRCAEVLARVGEAFVYPIIAKFGDNSDLLSYELWNLDRLLVFNYIDTLSLIRKDVWEEVGGFAEDLPALEDYDFWLRLAAKGHRGVQVPEILARYRVHHSTVSARNYHRNHDICRQIRNRHPTLPWPSP